MDGQHHHIYVVYIDSETDFGAHPTNAATVQVAMHSRQMGLDIRLGDPIDKGKRAHGGDLWASAFRILKCISASLVNDENKGILVLLLAHNGFNFDFLNAISEMRETGSGREMIQWISDPESTIAIRFGDTLEILMRELSARPPTSFSLDALYAMFMGRNVAIVNRHDALEDARALRCVMDAAGIRHTDVHKLCTPTQPWATWSDLVVMHRAWSVREGLLKNPSRPTPVPRVFPMIEPHETDCISKDPVVVITLFKSGEEGHFSATIAKLGGSVLYVFSSTIGDRCRGLPGRMRAWAQVVRSIGRRTKASFVLGSHFEHPLMAKNSNLLSDPPCIIPDETTSVMLVDHQADTIRTRISRTKTDGLTQNAEDAVTELASAYAQAKKTGIRLVWITDRSEEQEA
jgi:hypothetical protein